MGTVVGNAAIDQKMIIIQYVSTCCSNVFTAKRWVIASRQRM